MERTAKCPAIALLSPPRGSEDDGWLAIASWDAPLLEAAGTEVTLRVTGPREGGQGVSVSPEAVEAWELSTAGVPRVVERVNIRRRLDAGSGSETSEMRSALYSSELSMRTSATLSFLVLPAASLRFAAAGGSLETVAFLDAAGLDLTDFLTLAGSHLRTSFIILGGCES